jgi:hypothetical protein
MSDDVEICNWCLSVFSAEQALFDMVPDSDGRGLVVAACSPEHMLALGARVREPAAELPD